MMKRILFALCLLLCSPSFAGVHFFGDYLYWQPMSNNLDYAYLQALSGNQPFEGVVFAEPDYSSGYRLGLFSCLPCFGLKWGAEYLHFSQEGSDQISIASTGRFPSSTVLPPGNAGNTAGVQYKGDLDVVDILLGYPICNRTFLLVSQIGVRFAQIEQRVDSQILRDVPFVVIAQKQRLKMVGATIGIDGFLHPPSLPLGIFARGRLAFLHAWEEGLSALSEGSIPLNIQYHRNRFIPSFELSAGLDYICSCVELRAGYELQGYLIDSFVGPTEFPGFNQVTREQTFFGFGGLVVRAAIFY